MDGAKQHRHFVAYYRVSTGQQAESGLGIEAQRAAVCDFVTANDGRLVFIAADMPLANRFTIHILAAVAEYEARLISERTRAAFAAAKARGRKFGSPNPLTHKFSCAARKARVRAERERSKRRALDFLPLLCQLRDRGLTINEIAQHLSASGVPRPAAARLGVITLYEGRLSMVASGSRNLVLAAVAHLSPYFP